MQKKNTGAWRSLAYRDGLKNRWPADTGPCVRIAPPPSQTLVSDADVNQVRSLRPAFLCRFLGDSPTLFWCEPICACSPALLSAQASHLDRSGIALVWLGVRCLARGDVSDHFR